MRHQNHAGSNPDDLWCRCRSDRNRLHPPDSSARCHHRDINHDRRASTPVTARTGAGQEIIIAVKPHATTRESRIATVGAAATETTQARSVWTGPNRTGAVESGRCTRAAGTGEIATVVFGIHVVPEIAARYAC